MKKIKLYFIKFKKNDIIKIIIYYLNYIVEDIN